MRLLLLPILLSVLAETALVGQERPPTWKLEEALRIGAVDGPDAFEYVGKVVVSPRSGRIFASDGSDRIIALDPDGERIGTIGRRGRGPGEFEIIHGIYWLDGAVVVSDYPLRTLTRFDEQGAVIDVPISQPDQFSATFPSGRAVAPLSSGDFLGWALKHVPDGALVGNEYSLFRMDGVGGDSLLDRHVVAERVILGTTWLPIPMAPVWRYAVHPYGESIVVVHQSIPEEDGAGEFRVRRLDGAGRLLFSRAYNYPARELPADYLDSVLEHLREGLQYFGVSLRDAEALVRPHMPRFELPVTEVQDATDGSIWLRREDHKRTQVRWLVLDARGDPVGQLQLPAHLRLLHIGDDVVWAVDEDEWGVHYLVKYSLKRPSHALRAEMSGTRSRGGHGEPPPPPATRWSALNPPRLVRSSA